MQPAIRVENLSKSYRIGHQAKAGYRTLRESVTNSLAGMGRRFGQMFRPTEAQVEGEVETFWALKDVSFEVQPGEVVGIIGRNGAGKSTLLKILSRITEPTSGRAEIHGRMGSLLEVGTGFHPELTGRENIYLNGSILGMTRREIDRKFDEIVAFSEIEQFLDTPVKRYSSGMYVRLAFAVAAHLEPEILLVDEVLAVGDASFQRRCLDRMAELAQDGRTILFVSHNMELIPRLCERAVLLDHGRAKTVGPADEVTRVYLEELIEQNRDGNLSSRRRSGDGRARFIRAELVDGDGRAILAHVSGDDLTVRMQITADEDVRDVALAVVLQSLHGLRVITSWTREVDFAVDLCRGTHWYECRFRRVPLRPGHTIRIDLWMAAQTVLDSVENALVLDVASSAATRQLSPNADQGAVVCEYEWAQVSEPATRRTGVAHAAALSRCGR